MYKIKDKAKAMIAKYGFTSLNINGVYTKAEWNKAGFKDDVLETV